MTITNRMSRSVGLATKNHRAQGYMTLMVVFLMAAGISLIVAYYAKTGVFRERILSNETRYFEAFSAAESGLELAMAQLRSRPGWVSAGPVNLSRTLEQGSSYDLQLQPSIINYRDRDATLVDINVAGSSEDTLAVSNQQLQALILSIVMTPPNAPVQVKGTMNLSGNFLVAANPNGGGQGVPISVWSEGAVAVTGSGQTCGQQEYYDGVCGSQSYSESGSSGIDIVDNATDFPDDLFEHTFAISADNWLDVKAKANVVVSSCANLPAVAKGLVWVTGSCTLNSNVEIGSTEEPIILVVQDANVRFNGGMILNGMLFSFKSPGHGVDFEVDMLGGSLVKGAMLANHQVGHSGGTCNIVYDIDTMSNLATSDDLNRLYKLQGSWSDF